MDYEVERLKYSFITYSQPANIIWDQLNLRNIFGTFKKFILALKYALFSFSFSARKKRGEKHNTKCILLYKYLVIVTAIANIRTKRKQREKKVNNYCYRLRAGLIYRLFLVAI